MADGARRFPPPRVAEPVAVHIHLASAAAHDALGQMDAQPERKAKEAVNYRLGAGEDNCGACRFGNFADGALNGVCSKVSGEIRRAYVCDLFASKTRDAHGR